ncbi:ATP-binding cassette domain-containing protein [Celeribacter sp. PS-C1]|uniref:ATP-binding cassette domain-containing protein n=1 Tax=Celeribacter sp. PS-C1 TaxID=2820813 RepID=UPI001CA4904F|nr:ATP-binding cassette domain-containing protein [Celeribacter sp. PS-C1]MBW6418903.1 ATP-binding cassette domain-containing protein [Celeribacter sp. PS-C1]
MSIASNIDAARTGSHMETNVHSLAEAPITIGMAGITKSFSGVYALTDVTVAFRAGEVHAVLGENGAGKSTLMSIISGVLQPDRGEITFEGRSASPLTPEKAAELGIAISYQHPAIVEDLSVLENLQVSLPPALFEGRKAQEVAREVMSAVGLDVPLNMRAEGLTIGQKLLLEIAKALATKPKVLILDEPTASLDKDASDMLFERVRAAAARGTAVIYITHRLAEIRQIGHRVTVLRDGHVAGSGLVRDLSDSELLDMIVGRKLDSTFPPKAKPMLGQANLTVKGLGGHGFSDVSFEARPGEIVGIAGVAGNGQTELMRALAGLDAAHGELKLAGQRLSHKDLIHAAAFMPADRLVEGVAKSFSVRENAALGALEKFASFGFMSRRKEHASVVDTFRELSVKTPGLEAKITALSGGNQQKVVLARALLEQPGLIVADEPTQGVDVGARFEMYRILREISGAGTPVVVNSSDAAELEGLCDRVIVLSKGRVVATLTGEDVVEAKIVAAAVGADHHAETGAERRADQSRGGALRHFLQSDNAPVVPLLAIMVGLALYGYSQNANFLSSFNVYNTLMLATTLCFISMGQTIVLMLRGVDLSVGPLAGLSVVIASFFVNDGASLPTMLTGFGLMLAVAVVVGLANGSLVRYAKFTPIAATLAMYMGLQGISFLMREGPGGYISYDVTAILGAQIGPLPWAFVALIVCVIVGEYVLRKTRIGWQIRAVGSDEEAARRIGLNVNRLNILGYVATALFVFVGALMLMAQIGVGDPQQGTSYTLASITAVVLGGTSLRGGRGTFIGTALGAVLLTEIFTAIAFLGLSQTYQYVFQGALIVFAAVIYTTLRGRPQA